MLAEDCRYPLPDGRLLDQSAFLAQTAHPVTIAQLEARAVAIIHARTTFIGPDGRPGASRSTGLFTGLPPRSLRRRRAGINPRAEPAKPAETG